MSMMIAGIMKPTRNTASTGDLTRNRRSPRARNTLLQKQSDTQIA
jgi:hypothetical protein